VGEKKETGRNNGMLHGFFRLRINKGKGFGERERGIRPTTRSPNPKEVVI
jgi:hypothetical protein